jgi:hypothetical protein
MAEPAHVTLSGDIEGDYLVADQGPGGELRLVPEYPSEQTSIAAIRKRTGTRPLSPAEFDRHFGELPRDGEG